MPKINVYLPDELAADVRAASISVSPVCQRALADEVRRVGVVRSTTAQVRDPSFDPSSSPQAGSQIWGHMTGRLQDAARLALELPRPLGNVGTIQLLVGLLDQGDNLALRVLDSLGVDPDALRAAAVAADDDGAGQAIAPHGAGREEVAPLTGLDPGKSRFLVALDRASQLAVAAALDASVELGHRYLGCEHVLLGLLADEDGGAGRVLRSFGVDRTSARRAIKVLVEGFDYARNVDRRTTGDLTAVLGRLASLERRLDSLDGVGFG
ncbi:MAG TPA: Clp protease N-terminal domain-containing protein [Acidimicrobiales bacterium]